LVMGLSIRTPRGLETAADVIRVITRRDGSLPLRATKALGHGHNPRS
jgi:hypothetical protein